MTRYDLGPMTGGKIHQYANAAGQVIYHDLVANTITLSIPDGLEDNPDDTWTRDLTKSWEQWNNTRTGRATLMDPNPPPPQTYLDTLTFQAQMNVLVKVPESPERAYQMLMNSILDFIFPQSGPYGFYRAPLDVNGPIFTVFKSLQAPGGHFTLYEFMMVESRTRSDTWGVTKDHLHSHLASTKIKSKNCYGLIQIGLEVQFYKYEGGIFSEVSERMHLVTDAKQVVAWSQYIKEHEMPFI